MSWLLRIIAALITTVLVIWFVAANVDFSIVVTSLQNVDLSFALLGFFAFLMGHFFRFFRYAQIWIWPFDARFMAASGCHGAASYMLPMRLGELLLPYLAQRLGDRGFFSVLGGLLWIRFFDVGVVILLACSVAIAGILFPGLGIGGGEISLLGNSYFATGAGFILAVIALLVVSLVFVSWLVSTRFEALKGTRERLLFVVFSLFIWCFVLLMNYLLAKSLGASLGFPNLVLLLLVSTFAYAIPVQGLAGLGAHQLAWFFTLREAGITKDLSLAISLSSHVVVVIWVLGLAVIAALLAFFANNNARRVS